MKVLYELQTGRILILGGKEHNCQEEDKYSSAENTSENVCHLQQKCSNSSKPVTTFCDEL